MSKQFEQFELLYKQILATSIKIKKLIDEADYDSILSEELHKSQLISKVKFVEKTLTLTDMELGVIDDLKQQILHQEKENLDRVKVLRDKTEIELQKEISKDKFMNKYEVQELESGSICDYISD